MHHISCTYKNILYRTRINQKYIAKKRIFITYFIINKNINFMT